MVGAERKAHGRADIFHRKSKRLACEQDQGAACMDQGAGNENRRERLRQRGRIPGNPIAAARMPAMSSQSTARRGDPSPLRAAWSGIILCNPSVEPATATLMPGIMA